MADLDEQFSLPMGVAQIERCLPHRYPFLLIDRVIDYTAGSSIRAIKNVSVTEPLLQGHFPGNPVVPGVLVVECMAQASAILGRLTKPEKLSACLLVEIEKTRFRRQVVPGDVMEIEVSIVKGRQGFFWFSGKVSVDQEVAATATFSAKLA